VLRGHQPSKAGCWASPVTLLRSVKTHMSCKGVQQPLPPPRGSPGPSGSARAGARRRRGKGGVHADQQQQPSPPAPESWPHRERARRSARRARSRWRACSTWRCWSSARSASPSASAGATRRCGAGPAPPCARPRSRRLRRLKRPAQACLRGAAMACSGGHYRPVLAAPGYTCGPSSAGAGFAGMRACPGHAAST
jgi:hypothetical protein